MKGAMLSTPSTVSKGVSNMKYTTEQLEAIAAKLRDMPPVEKKKQEHSKQEAVRILAREIAALQKRGYTLDQISETLRGEGLSIATPTLKSYLQRAKPAKKAPAQAPGDTPPARPALKKPADTSKATFTPKPDSDDI
jgi:methionine synthase II (cobalamin-independent)